MAARARLIAVQVPRDPVGVVLVMHGGGSRRDEADVSPRQPSVLRMVPIAWRIARRGRDRLAVYRLLNSSRGWDEAHTPVDDARWALTEIRGRLGALPASIVGHSLGGRAALLAGAEPGAASVVALNPYVYPGDGSTDLSGRTVLVVQGTADRVSDPGTTEQVAGALARRADLCLIRVRGGKHGMVGRHRVFDRLAADFVAVTALGARPDGVLAAAMAGDGRQDV